MTLADFLWLIFGLVLALGTVWVGFAAGKEYGYRSAKADFDLEVDETARAKVQRQLHDANRSTLPRQDSGPSARVTMAVGPRKPQHRKKS